MDRRYHMQHVASGPWDSFLPGYGSLTLLQVIIRALEEECGLLCLPFTLE